MINAAFWKGKKVFLTGHTGFKGSWLSLWLLDLGAEVYGYALPPATDPSLFEACQLSTKMHSKIGDIRNLETLKKSLKEANPDIVIHLASQPLVRKAYRDPVETYSTNVMGTVNVLEAGRELDRLKVLINVTTDKVYENEELDVAFKEIDRLGGKDPYSNSKACSELVTSSYRSSFFKNSEVKVVTARAGNVIGGGDWSEDRLIPDMIRAMTKKEKVIIRHPSAIRPWQHVLESLSGYLKLVEFLYQEGKDYLPHWNFGPASSDFLTVQDIVKIVKIDYEIRPDDLPEANILKIDNEQAMKHLSWIPQWSPSQAIFKTFDWYEQYLIGGDASDLTIKQIRDFQK
jgi:CDP-glucose 4,6-dehydratase